MPIMTLANISSPLRTKAKPGHAIASGRRRLNREDVKLAIRVALDSMPFERRRVIRQMQDMLGYGLMLEGLAYVDKSLSEE